jgi:hypothetical protein
MVSVVGLFLQEYFSKFREAKKTRKREVWAYIPFLFTPGRNTYMYDCLEEEREKKSLTHPVSINNQNYS